MIPTATKIIRYTDQYINFFLIDIKSWFSLMSDLLCFLKSITNEGRQSISENIILITVF